MDATGLLVTDLEVDTVLADLTVPLAVRTVWQLELAERLLAG
ncbi:hypothetical protein [Streptomyces sp. 5-6(2022)]|nr:hypothetical protein [Streptomyces sp. 5-6(2022)]